jgi:hypothetical protein
MRIRDPRTFAVLTAGTLAGVLLTGCDAADKVSGPDPDDAAATLAAALTSGDFTEVAFASDTPEQVTKSYDTVVEGMGDVEPEVAAGDVDEDGDAATAHLSWSWPVADREWTYETTVPMKRVDDEWQVVWQPSVIEADLGEDDALDLTPIAAKRGAIVGARGVKLVTDRPVIRFGIDRGQVAAKKAGASARRLAA